MGLYGTAPRDGTVWREGRLRKVLVIGIGTGDPEHLTVQAVRALNRVDVVFAMDKRAATAELVRLRREICERYITDRSYRFVEAADPPRREVEGSYRATVDAWHEERAALYERLIRDELAEGMTGAFLVWGDPSLYDSTLRTIDRVLARGGVAFDHEVVPGISSVQVLASRHRTALNRVGAAVHVTTGRRLAAEGLQPDLAEGAGTVVMLDGDMTFRRLANREELEIVWGAYLGTPDEILIAGRLAEVADRIGRARADAKARKGWIMDVYLLRRIEAG